MNHQLKVNTTVFILLGLLISSSFGIAPIVIAGEDTQNQENDAKLIWRKTYGGDQGEGTNAFVQTKEGEFVLRGGAMYREIKTFVDCGSNVNALA